VSPGGSP